MNWQHCTRDTVRKTTNDMWPLRRANGTVWHAKEGAIAASGTGATQQSRSPKTVSALSGGYHTIAGEE